MDLLLTAPRQAVSRIALQDQVYEILKERVLDRAYEPQTKLNIDALARELKVSSSPVREALGRLSAEGLVRAEPFVGFAIAAIPSRAYYDQLYALRLVIEPWAASETARRRPSAAIEELEASAGAMGEGKLERRYHRFRGYSEADEAFHRAIIAGTGNEPAIKAYGDLRIHLHLSRLYINREQDTAASHREHLAILDAIRSGEAEQAAARMRDHLVASKAKLLDEPSD